MVRDRRSPVSLGGFAKQHDRLRGAGADSRKDSIQGLAVIGIRFRRLKNSSGGEITT